MSIIHDIMQPRTQTRTELAVLFPRAPQAPALLAPCVPHLASLLTGSSLDDDTDDEAPLPAGTSGRGSVQGSVLGVAELTAAVKLLARAGGDHKHARRHHHSIPGQL